MITSFGALKNKKLTAILIGLCREAGWAGPRPGVCLSSFL